MSSTLALAVAAVVAAATGVGAALAVRRRGPLGVRNLVAGIGAALGVGALAALVVESGRGPGAPRYEVVLVLYLGLTVAGPLLGIGLLVAWWRRGARRFVPIVAVMLVVPGPLGIYATYVEPNRLRVDRVTVAIDPARRGDDDVRVVVLADIQTDRVGATERRAVDAALAAEPDLIVIAGDLFQGSPAALDRWRTDMRDLLGRLEAPHGVYFVAGDSDGVLDDPDGPARQVLEGTGIVALADEIVTIEVGDRLVRLGGTQVNHTSRSARTVGHLLGGEPDDGAITLLLAHRPDTVLHLPPSSRVDLTIAGHTHGGQVAVPGFGPIVTRSAVPRDVAAGGLHEVVGNRIYVSTGVGVLRDGAPRVRLFVRPSIGVLTLTDA